VSVAIPLIVGRFVDGLVQRRFDFNLLWVLGGVYGATFLLSYAGEVIYTHHKFLAAQELRDEIFANSMYLPIRQIRERGSAYFATLIGDQVNDAFVVIDYPIVKNVASLVRMVAVLFVVLQWDLVLFALFLMNVTFVAFYSRIIHRATHRLVAQGLELGRTILGFITESLENIHELWAHGGVTRRYKQYQSLSGQYATLAVQAETARVRLDKWLVDLPVSVSRVLLLLYGGIQVTRGALDVGTLWPLWVYLGYITDPLYIFRELSRVATQSAATVRDVLGFLAIARAARASREPAYHRVPGDTPGVVWRVNGLTRSAGERRILDDISMVVSEREIVGVVGLSGEGKSTLLNVLLGFEQEYAGSVHLMGEDIRKIGPENLFRAVGYHSQQVGIVNDTLERNIAMGDPVDHRRLEWAIEELGLQHLRGRPLGEGGAFISGGERLRLQLARLSYGDRRIVVLDEPLTNIDLLAEQELTATLARYLKGRSGILISHKLNVLLLATRLIVLQEGKIAIDDHRDAVLEAGGLYRQLVDAFLETARSVGTQARSTNFTAG
jgi:ATP-binding cassette subfamily C protein